MPRAVNGMKECSKCRAVKPVSEFNNSKRAADGLWGSCRTCQSASRREWNAANPQKVKASQKKWASKNKERLAEYNRKWRGDNPDKYAAGIKRWVENNREAYNAYQRDYYHKNQEKIRLYVKTWRAERAHPNQVDLDDPS